MTASSVGLTGTVLLGRKPLQANVRVSAGQIESLIAPMSTSIRSVHADSEAYD
jgi:hypothetical protein